MDIVAVDDSKSRALTTAASTSSSGKIISKEQVQWLREQREKHRYKTIWTKDPHGGPYRKANGGKGIDPFKENLDGSLKEVELGYEEAEVGPTSNFVGNHMTQGAIDMVQALLNMKTNPAKDRDEKASGPRLLKHGEDAPKQPPVRDIPSQTLDIVTTNDARKTTIQIKDHQNSVYKSLDIAEWYQDEDAVVIIFQRPYSEDVSVSMSLSTTFSETKVTVSYLLTAKDGMKIKEYRKEIDPLHRPIDPSKSACHLGGGTLDEMRASPNLVGQCIPVSHSHPSTMICLVLHKLEPSCEWRALEQESSQHTEEFSLRLPHDPRNNLKDLKSFIRSNRKK